MPRYRPDLENIPTYVPGRSESLIAADLGLDRILELASNECPDGPMPEIQESIAQALVTANRYPPTDAAALAEALADHYAIAPDRVWVGPGSTSILTTVALAASGPGTSVMFADPSFVVYPMAALLAGAETLPIPVDAAWRLDPDGFAAALRPDTAVIYYCNPNNPTGTHSSEGDIRRLVESVPDSVTIVIDEAYAEFVVAADYASAIPLTNDHDNVIVTRTFSKVYGLAGLRIGYAIGDPTTIRALRRLQVPFATGSVAQIAAIEALKHQDVIARRVESNSRGRTYLSKQLQAAGQTTIDSQTNFVSWEPEGDPRSVATELLGLGARVRPLGRLVRVTVGTEDENSRAIEAISSLG